MLSDLLHNKNKLKKEILAKIEREDTSNLTDCQYDSIPLFSIKVNQNIKMAAHYDDLTKEFE